MKVESWQGINGKLIHDGQKAIVVDDDQALTDQKQLQAILDQDGQPIDEVQQAMIKKTVKRQLKTEPLKLSGWFNRHQDSQNAKKTEKLVSDKPTHQYKQIKNEMTFFGESFLEGFLGFYGLKVDNALGRYEHNLHVLETQELGQSGKPWKCSQCCVFAGVSNISIATCNWSPSSAKVAVPWGAVPMPSTFSGTMLATYFLVMNDSSNSSL